MPLIKGGGPLGLLPCGEPVEVGLIVGRDISGGGPSGLTDALVDRVPGGDVSLLGLRGTFPWPEVEMLIGVELELLPSCSGLLPVIGMRGGGLGTSPVVIPYRGVLEIPGDVLEGLGGEATMVCPPSLAVGESYVSCNSVVPFCGVCSSIGTSTFLAAAATSTKVAKADIGSPSAKGPAFSSLARSLVPWPIPSPLINSSFALLKDLSLPESLLLGTKTTGCGSGNF